MKITYTHLAISFLSLAAHYNSDLLKRPRTPRSKQLATSPKRQKRETIASASDGSLTAMWHCSKLPHASAGHYLSSSPCQAHQRRYLPAPVSQSLPKAQPRRCHVQRTSFRFFASLQFLSKRERELKKNETKPLFTKTTRGRTKEHKTLAPHTLWARLNHKHRETIKSGSLLLRRTHHSLGATSKSGGHKCEMMCARAHLLKFAPKTKGNNQ